MRQYSYVNLNKIGNFNINDNKTEQVMVIDESCFDEARITKLNNWKMNNFSERDILSKSKGSVCYMGLQHETNK